MTFVPKIKEIHRTDDRTWAGTYDDGVSFEADPSLFLIKRAWDRGCDLEDLADGFGPIGTMGDWSAIRDSSAEAKDLMLLEALVFLGLDEGL